MDDHLDIEDVAELDPLNEDSLMSLIGSRYKAAPIGRPAPYHLIYTRAGPIIVAVNPLTPVVDLYTASKRARHHRAALAIVRQEREGTPAGIEAENLPPHIYDVSGKAYHQMCEGKSQAVVINGESGAGKTETTKLLLHHLSEVSGGSTTLAAKLLASSPVLEAFGNAKTLRNDNSSRFGKLIKLHFTQDSGSLHHASICHYLLEKSRVVHQQVGEQGFHVMYMLCVGVKSPQREQLQLGRPVTAPSIFSYMQPTTRDVSEEAYIELQTALRTMLANSSQEIDVYWQTVSAILHLGQIDFVQVNSRAADPGSSISPPTMDAALTTANLLGCSVEDLESTLCTRTIMGISSPRSPREAKVARDTLAKAIYERVFNQIVEIINEALMPEEGSQPSPQRELFIGLLDIFGSEIFEVNGFEQMLINFANDKLQYYFTQTAISLVIAEYTEEQISTAIILSSFDDISPTLALIEGVPIYNTQREGQTSVCLLSLLDDDTRYSERAQQRDDKMSRLSTSGSPQPPQHNGSRDEKFVEKLNEKLGKADGFIQPNGRTWDPKEGRWITTQGYNRKQFMNCHFAIRHFGATVPYNASNFCDKNIDPLDKEILSLMNSCATHDTGLFVSSLFAIPPSQHRSISFKFRDEMHDLVETLRQCDGHFIRCIKPNDKRMPFHIDEAITRAQLQSCGVLEAAKVSQAGYPKRIPYRDMFAIFMGQHALRRTRAHRNEFDRKKLVQSLAVKVLRLKYSGSAAEDTNDFALGRTRIFLKRGVWEKCMKRQQMLLSVIGEPAVAGPGGRSATGLRKWRISWQIYNLNLRVKERLKDKVFWDELREMQKVQEIEKLKRAEDAERERQKQVGAMVEAAKVAAVEVAEREALKVHSHAMLEEKERHAGHLERELQFAAEEQATALEALAATHAKALDEKQAELEKVLAVQSELRRDKVSLELRNEELHEWRVEAEWQRQEIDRLEARLRVREREADAMIVDYSEAEIAFYSDHEKLRTDLQRMVTFEGLKDDAHFWYLRGQHANPGKPEGTQLARQDRMKVKAARTHLLHAAKLAEQQIAMPPWQRHAFLTRPSAAEEEEEALKRRRQVFVYQLSAANMTKKLDASWALVEYEDVIEKLRAHQKDGSSAFDDLLRKAEDLRQDADLAVNALRNSKRVPEFSSPQVTRLSRGGRPSRNSRGDAGDGRLSRTFDSITLSDCKPVRAFRLETRTVSPDLLGFEYSAGEYRVNIQLESLSRVKTAGFAPYSSMTTLKKVTFSDADKAKFKVPRNAAFFAWAFPLYGSLGIEFEPNTAAEEVVAVGAFAFFKDAAHLISLTAVSFADAGSLFFAGPHLLLSLPSSTQKAKVKDGVKLREFLIDSSRIHPVTVPALKQAGAEYFSWFGPGEAIAAEDGSAWKHGAFVYLYPAGQEKFDCFLPLVL